MKDLRKLNDATLLSETKLAVARERESTSDVLRHLKEVDRRRLYSGRPSLHEYAVHELKYTDDEAQRRISAMRTLREVPEIEEKVMSGELSMTHIGIARSIFYAEKKQGREFAAVFDIALEATNPAKEPKRKTKEATKISIKRAVWKRDEAVCTECGSTYAIQEDHIVPKSLGGPYTLENMRLLCRACNQRAGIEKLGLDVMDPYLSPAAPRVEQREEH